MIRKQTAAFLLFCLNSICLAQVNIQTLINNAIWNNQRELVLPSGTHKIDRSLFIYGANSLKIRGAQTKLIFNPIAPNKNYDIQIEKSTGVTIQDLEIDNDPLPFTQGRVIKVDRVSNCFEVAIDQGYSRDTNQFGFNCYVHLHDSATKRLKQEGDMIYTTRTEWIPEGLRVFIKDGSIDYNNVRVNDLVSIGQPGFQCAISLYNTRNTLIQNVTIYSAPGCGVLENGGSGSVIDGLKIVRGSRPQTAIVDRLFSVNRDGLHLNGPKGGTIVKNCFFEFIGDDAVNIRSPFPQITYVSGNEIRHNISYTNFDTGSQLFVYDQYDLSLRDLVNVLDHQMGSMTARVDKIEKIRVGNLIVSPQHTENFKILNNTFVDIDARGIVASGSNIYIEGNKIERTTMGGIWVGAEFGYYDEGGFANNVFVRWNTLNETNFALRGRRQHTSLLGAISVVNEAMPHQIPGYKFKRPNSNIVIAENIVLRSGLASLFLAHLWNASVCKNSFFNDNNLYFNNAGNIFGIDSRYSIVIYDTSTVKIFQNWVIRVTYTRDMRVVTDSDTVTDPATNPCS